MYDIIDMFAAVLISGGIFGSIAAVAGIKVGRDAERARRTIDQ